MSEPIRTRCSAQAALPSGQWKSCIRERGHSESEPHVWIESFDVVGRSPIIVTWYGPRSTTPEVSTVVRDQLTER